MDLALAASLTLTVVALITVITVLYLAPSYVRARVRHHLRPELDRAADMVSTLKAERARAAGTIGAAVRRGVIPSEHGRGPLAAAAAAANSDGAVVDVPDWIVNIAKGAGVDMERLLAGDPDQAEKVKTLLGHLKGPAPSSPGAQGRDYI